MNQVFVKKLYFSYHYFSRLQKRYLLILIDLFLFLFSIGFAFFLRFNLILPLEEIQTFSRDIISLLCIKIIVFYWKNLYRSVLRHTGIEFLSTALKGVIYSSGILICIAYFCREAFLPRSVLIIDAFLTLVLVVGVRLLIRFFYNNLNAHVNNVEKSQSVVIYGAGVAGSQLARSLQYDDIYRIVAFVDDSPDLQYQLIQGIKVYPPAQLPRLQLKQPFNLIILALPSLSLTRKQEIIKALEPLGVAIKTVPPLRSLLSGRASINQICNVDVAQLLGREEILPYPELLSLNVTEKSVLVTGAGGSIGSELCRQIATLKPKCLVLYELNEFALYKIDLELAEYFPQVKRFAYLGNVTDENYLEKVIRKHAIDTIYHTAAYKHVPMVEANAAQGLYNNIWGTLSAARCAIALSVSHFVLISTDKAVRPTNIMGASKRVAELVIQALSARANLPTCFAMVRFGNVLDSSGSVVPRFRQQIAQGKAITVTHPEITRYFMSISEAVRLVMQAGAMAKGGEVFLLDMGEPIRIYDLALQMVRLSGLEPGRDINISITGLRPGEKLYEELLIDGNNIQPTKHPKIFSANEYFLPWEKLHSKLELLLNKIRVNDYEGLVHCLQQLVPEYQPQSQFLNSPSIKPKSLNFQ